MILKQLDEKLADAIVKAQFQHDFHLRVMFLEQTIVESLSLIRNYMWEAESTAKIS